MRQRKGFTLIELLIVITLLGILAVAVLAAINPIEQINRSRDTATRNDAGQLISAIERYYATRGFYPWMEGSADDAVLEEGREDLIQITGADQLFGGGTGQPMLQLLSGGGTAELKESYIARIVAARANPLFIYNRGQQGDSTYVCFIPRSAAIKEEGWNRCTETDEFGELPADYPRSSACPQTCAGPGISAADAVDCSVCLP